MTDPSDALPLFQQSLLEGHIPLQPGKLDKELFLASDEVNGYLRLSYLRLQDKTIVALVQFVAIDPLDELPCFQIGYAVPERFRGQGIAKKAVAAALTEMVHGFACAGIREFYVEAIVGLDNLASQKLGEALLTRTPETVTDDVSGKPALRYLRRVGNQTS